MHSNEKKLIPNGIPIVHDYLSLLKSNMFNNIEKFSNEFIVNNIKILNNYKWVRDPLHQWSRQWEYPFVYSNIVNIFNSQNYNKLKILDAGSGCTFFPYYIKYIYPEHEVWACDQDDYHQLFNQVNKRQHSDIVFKVCDLENVKLKYNHFDVIYCISVLEHLENHTKVIKNLKEVLAPKGHLIITFDISLDKKASITLTKGQKILDSLNNEFEPLFNITPEKLPKILTENNILTTEFIKKYNSKLLPPWKISVKKAIKQIINLKAPKRPFYKLTVFCGVWYRP